MIGSPIKTSKVRYQNLGANMLNIDACWPRFFSWVLIYLLCAAIGYSAAIWSGLGSFDGTQYPLVAMVVAILGLAVAQWNGTLDKMDSFTELHLSPDELRRISNEKERLRSEYYLTLLVYVVMALASISLFLTGSSYGGMPIIFALITFSLAVLVRVIKDRREVSLFANKLTYSKEKKQSTERIKAKLQAR